MKRRKLAALLLFLPFLAGFACARGYEETRQAGEYDVTMVIDNNPPVVGYNTVSVGIRDSSGKYVTDAKVVVDHCMHAKHGMPEMRYTADAVVRDSKYATKVHLCMPGCWMVDVKITRAGKTSTAKFSLNAG